MGLGAPGRRDDLVFARIRVAIQDIVPRRAIEHRRFLRDHPDLAAQALLRHVAHILAANHHAPRLGVVKPQHQGDQGRLPRPRSAHDPDLLARRHIQRHTVYAARLAPIGKADILKRDPGLLHHQINRPLAIHQRMRRRQSIHPVLGLANIAVNRHQRMAHPTRHLRNADRNRPRRRNVARRGHTNRPEPKRTANQHHRHHPRHGHQAEPESGGNHAIIQHPLTESADGVQRFAFLVVRMGKEFHRLDIGHGVHHLPRHHRPRPRPRFRAHPNTRHEPADHEEVPDHPKPQRQSHPAVDGRQQQRRPDQ